MDDSCTTLARSVVESNCSPENINYKRTHSAYKPNELRRDIVDDDDDDAAATDDYNHDHGDDGDDEKKSNSIIKRSDRHNFIFFGRMYD